jgi:hypothetical protein
VARPLGLPPPVRRPLGQLETEVAGIVETHYGPHREEAARANARIERRSGVDILDPESRVRLSTTDLGK